MRYTWTSVAILFIWISASILMVSDRLPDPELAQYQRDLTLIEFDQSQGFSPGDQYFDAGNDEIAVLPRDVPISGYHHPKAACQVLKTRLKSGL